MRNMDQHSSSIRLENGGTALPRLNPLDTPAAMDVYPSEFFAPWKKDVVLAYALSH